MPYLVNTIEGRLQLRLGALTFENEALHQEIDDLKRQIADLTETVKNKGDTLSDVAPTDHSQPTTQDRAPS